jgi:hypothetical protein
MDIPLLSSPVQSSSSHTAFANALHAQNMPGRYFVQFDLKDDLPPPAYDEPGTPPPYTEEVDVPFAGQGSILSTSTALTLFSILTLGPVIGIAGAMAVNFKDD